MENVIVFFTVVFVLFLSFFLIFCKVLFDCLDKFVERLDSILSILNDLDKENKRKFYCNFYKKK